MARANVDLARLPRHVVQVALGVGGELVDRRRHAARFERLDGRHRAQRAGGAEQMADHRLHRADRNAIGVLAQRQLERFGLGRVVERRAGAVRADVVDLVGPQLGVANRLDDGSTGALAARLGRADVVRVGGDARAGQLGQDVRAARLERARAFRAP